jgi:heme exporter protein CcmD
MMGLGQHAVFILASYAVTFLVLGALVAWLVMDGQRLKSMLDRLEAAGGRRGRNGSSTSGERGRH